MNEKMTTCVRFIRRVPSGFIMCGATLNDGECIAYHPVLPSGIDGTNSVDIAADWPARLSSVRVLTDVARSTDGVRMICGWWPNGAVLCNETLLARATDGGTHATVLDVVNTVLEHHHDDHAEMPVVDRAYGLPVIDVHALPCGCTLDDESYNKHARDGAWCGWRCTRCGHKHHTDPQFCVGCGWTVLAPMRMEDWNE